MVLVSKEVVIDKDSFVPSLELTLRLPFSIIDNTGLGEDAIALLIGKQMYSVLESVVNDS